jgi:hypothetical protein|tara:strand:+ start:281 stop:685 length:405 start_codon:yes stop_codon:yes gene_type:complete
MTTIFNDVQAALDTKLATVTGTNVAFPNVPYTPQAGTSYLRASFLPAETTQAGLGANGKDETNGIYQIDVVVPRGSGRPQLIDTVADLFKRGTVSSYNSVNVRVRSVSMSPAILDEEWYFVPISVNFQTFTEAR